VDSLISKSVSC